MCAPIAGIKTAADSTAALIGIREWARPPGIYVRGFLAEDYGVDLAVHRWLQAGVNKARTAPRRSN